MRFHTKANSIYLIVLVSLLFALIPIISCKKEDGQYKLRGTVSNGNNGAAMQGVQLRLQKQAVSGGVAGGGFSTAASGATDQQGNYSLEWPRENFTALRLLADKDQYISRVFDLPVNDFKPGVTITKSFSLYPQAFISVQVQSAANAAASDQLRFTFTNAQFDCSCCENGWRNYTGPNVNSTFECKLYGDRWIKHQRHIQTTTLDTLISDSTYCPAFQTTSLSISF